MNAAVQTRLPLPAAAASLAIEAWTHGEPTLSAMIADPVIVALMERDGISPAEIDRLVASVRERAFPLYVNPLGQRSPANFMNP